MASAVATIGELVPDDREIVVGMGTGGALVNSLFRRDRPVSAVREAITLMRALWTGEPVALDAFPVLGAALGYRPQATAQLTYPARRRPDIVLAGVGPKILAVAATHADGLISPGSMPSQSRAALLAQRCSESLADALIISGTPELRDLAAAHGYTEFYAGAPLGPDPAEAADLLLTEIPRGVAAAARAHPRQRPQWR
ncbi:LLM class flavin-dependent oxidoreductase [Dactylosporangium sp. NPDC049140]|uniref:LLM class flavin-dependent oxidoreductase n=1 Tax=Dactylosporangium sp. NPDC049140 TaxID=3155647 RepID=UPI00340AEEAF